MYVREVDHRRALTLLETAAASRSRQAFVANVMPPLRTLFRADEVSYAEVLAGSGTVVGSSGYPTATTALPHVLRVWETRSVEHPWVAHLAARRAPASVRLSELCSRADLRRSAFYQDFFRPRGVEHADYQTIALSSGHAFGLGVCRQGRDFSDDEHDLFEHVRRPLGRIWHLVAQVEDIDVRESAGAPRLAEPLTPAEQRVSDLVLRGWRTSRVAEVLGVSQKAVEQHLTRIYRKAGVSSRSQYLANAHGRPAKL